ncbi:MAG TPA: septum formation initiator family protein [Bacteroidetes bacterium]|nr:septum formation initiator family protein [Bacteroidota bacterium]
MSGLNQIFRVSIPILRNKYVLSSILFLLWIAFFDTNNLIDRAKQLKELHQLEADREYYIRRIEHDTRRMNELETDLKSLEKFAREQYLMKKENEDVFIIVEE